MIRRGLLAWSMCASLAVTLTVHADDWMRFRGPNGSGVSDDDSIPTEWSDTENMSWKAELPGPGSSSPIIVGDRVFITCWSGYGTDSDNPGNKEDLKLHLVCLNRTDGEILWTGDIEPTGKEEDYRGMFAQHGYASHTPASDGKNIYAYFGKSGAVAFDLDGNRLWDASIGTESDPRGWGSASSPVLVGDKMIIPATAESQALVALDKETGEEVWRQEAQGFTGTWGTPVVCQREDGLEDLVIGVPYEVWGFNPETGKMRWFAESVESDSMCSSVIEHEGTIYLIEGRSGGSIAIRSGGKGDVTDTNVLWSGRERGRISTPVFYNQRIYWISGGIVSCIDAKTGDQLFQARLQSGGDRGRDEQSADRDGSRESARGGPGGGFGRGSGGGRSRGGMGGQSYASPVVAGDQMYYVDRSGTTYVIGLGDEYKLLATNQFSDDDSDFSGTPAISDGQLFIRSNKYLYCIAEE
ncbi:outer membrane biogenesis protein BamB [Thalassoglobus neptunius]|uniref:Outer membrane biogenesis protein BamB n=1 Tax=Thalassoglobus neptunius TaxID=1938619 RepID=A0A5C5X0X4_9PLAN|nr:PQQ-binding-like beta-propeller repeat protein [Thalassoglobus neptunius]TWT56794.1 outer membrane biogenesis protein BamB [Thalassoglobus neptunius]